ncbi:unnamed protein product [Durusdinium trenchii]|uniref:CAP-Gly domain-containing protein n=1 Tax=Durusdinium trenchii TaxID=1381693 RepID=A0ABP0SKL3_9DINO
MAKVRFSVAGDTTGGGAKLDLTVGDKVELAVSGKLASGVVRFLGTTDFAHGNWAGIRLDEPIGKNDGTVDGKFYFECERDHGLFARPDTMRKKAAGRFKEATKKVLKQNEVLRSVEKRRKKLQEVGKVEADEGLKQQLHTVRRATRVLANELLKRDSDLQGYNEYNQIKLRSEAEALEVAHAELALQFEEREAEYKAEQMQKELNRHRSESDGLEHRAEMMQQELRQELAAAQEQCVFWQQMVGSDTEEADLRGLEESRKGADEMQSREAELKEEVQEAVEEKRSAEEVAKSLQARLEQKEKELRRRQDEREEAAKAATDAEEETQKLRLELEAKIALQTEKTELEVYAKLMQEELNAAQAEQVALRHTIERTETGEGHLRQELAAEKAEKSAECKRCPASKGEAAQTTLADEKMRNLEEALSKARSQHDKELAASRGEIEALEQKGFQKSFYRTLSQAQDKELAALREQIDVLERREQKRQSAEEVWREYAIRELVRHCEERNARDYCAALERALAIGVPFEKLPHVYSIQRVGKELQLPDMRCGVVTMQLCLILDYTSSMKEHVENVRMSVAQIMDNIRNFQVPLQPYAHVELEIGAVAFNDWDTGTVQRDRPVVAAFGGKEIRKEHHGSLTESDFNLNGQFTKDSNKIVAWMNQGLGDGGMIPEELTGALLAASHLKWSAHKRLAIAITNAPCHGKDYSNAPHDDFCNSDSGLTCTGVPEKPLERLRDQGVKVCLFHTGQKTVTTMCEKLQETLPDLVCEKLVPTEIAARVTSLLEENLKLQPFTYLLKPLLSSKQISEESPLSHDINIEAGGMAQKHHIGSSHFLFLGFENPVVSLRRPPDPTLDVFFQSASDKVPIDGVFGEKSYILTIEPKEESVLKKDYAKHELGRSFDEQNARNYRAACDLARSFGVPIDEFPGVYRLCWRQRWSEIAPALISAVEKKQQLEPLKYSLELYDPYNEKAEEITSDLMPTLEIDVEKEHIIRRRNISAQSLLFIHHMMDNAHPTDPTVCRVTVRRGADPNLDLFYQRSGTVEVDGTTSRRSCVIYMEPEKVCTVDVTTQDLKAQPQASRLKEEERILAALRDKLKPNRGG